MTVLSLGHVILSFESLGFDSILLLVLSCLGGHLCRCLLGMGWTCSISHSRCIFHGVNFGMFIIFCLVSIPKAGIIFRCLTRGIVISYGIL